MVETALYYFEKARQCRRLSRVTNDARASEGLTALAEEFEAKAKAALTAERTISLLGDGIPGSLVPGEDGSAD